MNKMRILKIIALSLFITPYLVLPNNRWTEPSNIIILNTSKNEFAPSFDHSNNLLYYNSDSTGNSLFYICTINPEGGFSNPKLAKIPLNNLSNDQSYITFHNNKEAYLSKPNLYSKQAFLNIFKSDFIKNSWTEPLLLDSFAVQSFCSHPTISKAGDILIFASDKDSKSGTTDLWMSYRNENGSWGLPFKLEELNSPGNEITPYLHNEDTLYFSSDGFEGPGGYDIYMSVRRNNHWSRPFPIADINTEYNESDFVVLSDSRAVFSSDRPGGKGKLDLYISSPSNNGPKKNINVVPEISLMTQVSSLLVQKNSKVKIFPAFYFFNVKSFGANNLSNHIIDSLIYEYPMIVAKFLSDYPNESIVIDSSEINNMILNMFEAYGVSKNQIKFQKPYQENDFIRCRLLSGNFLPNIELSEDEYFCKPPVIEVSVDSREKISIKNQNLSLFAKSHHNFEIKDKNVPFRDILLLDDLGEELYKSDSVTIIHTCQLANGDKTNNYRTININRQQLKELYSHHNEDRKTESYFFIIPDNIFLNSDYFPIEYFNHLINSLNGSISVNISYYNNELSNQVLKFKELITNKTKGKNYKVQHKELKYSENEYFSKNISNMIIRVDIDKILKN